MTPAMADRICLGDFLADLNPKAMWGNLSPPRLPVSQSPRVSMVSRATNRPFYSAKNRHFLRSAAVTFRVSAVRKRGITAPPRKVARREKENESPTDSISCQLNTTNILLKSLVKRLEKHEKRLSEVEQKLCHSSDISSSSATTPVRRQNAVLPEVRVSLCKVVSQLYNILILFATERN